MSLVPMKYDPLYLKGGILRLVDAIARPFGADMAEHIHVRQIDITSEAAGLSTEITLTYRFEHAAPTRGKVAALDLSSCPLQLRELKGAGCNLRGPIRFAKRSIVFCELLSGLDWRSASAQVCVTWGPGQAAAASPSLLVFPNMLPALFNESFHVRRWPQAILHYTGSVSPAAYVQAARDANGSLRQLALYRGGLSEVFHPLPRLQIALGDGLAGLPPGKQSDVVSLLADIIGSASSDLRTSLDARILALAVEKGPAYPNVWGPCLVYTPSTYGETGARAGHLVLAQGLAGLLWAASVRLIGNNATELTMAICGALGIRWTAQVDAARGARCLEGYLKITKDVNRSMSHRLWTRWTVALYQGFQSGEGAMNVLRQLTATEQGYCVPVEDVLSALAGAGITLDLA